MCIDFRELKPEDAAWAAPIMTASGKMGCEFSYTTAYMWSQFYNVRIARVGDAVLLCSEADSIPSFLPPIGVSLSEGITLLRTYTEERAVPLRLHGVDEDTRAALCALYPDRVRFEEHDGDFDYVYETQALATLPGNTYHSKKNHISAFTRAHDWTFEPLREENYADVVQLSNEWCAERGGCDHSLQAEQCGIRRLLAEREHFSLTGGLIRVDGKAVAFTLGSPINDQVYDIHVEKALSAYAGAYAVINREFAATLTDYAFLNRENDMGIEGLRRAKRSYRPVRILTKYRCTVL